MLRQTNRRFSPRFNMVDLIYTITRLGSVLGLGIGLGLGLSFGVKVYICPPCKTRLAMVMAKTIHIPNPRLRTIYFKKFHFTKFLK